MKPKKEPDVCKSCLGLGFAQVIRKGLHPGFGTVTEEFYSGAKCPECGKMGRVNGGAIVPKEDIGRTS